MFGLNLPERYILILNLLIGVFIIPYFLALSVVDAVKLHLAGNILPAESQYTHRGQPINRAVRRSRAAYDGIVRRDIFNLAPPPAAAPVESETLAVKLIGTSQLSTGKPFAIIEDPQGTQLLYQVGQMIPDAGRLLEVTSDRAVILHNGHRVAIEIPRDAPPAQPGMPVPSPMHRFPQNSVRPRSPRMRSSVGGVRRLGTNQFMLDRSMVNNDVQNMAPLFSQIRAIPNMQNGAMNGFLLSEIQPNSIFKQIGLKDGDLLNAVNGQPVNDPGKAMTMLQSLQNQPSITLNVVRNGVPTQLHYFIR
jgi:general secretion pathway protein C